MIRLLAAGALLVLVSPLAAQATGKPVPLARFANWPGHWSGSGWSIDRNGRRSEFNLVETVTPKAGGTVLYIEGHGRRRDDSTVVTHNGVTLVYYDQHTGQYRWNGHEVASGAVDAEVRPIDGGLSWAIPAGPSGGTVRFTILVDGHRWHEVGEASGDGNSWIRFMEIDLARVE